jgi:hypothetical protein
MKAMQEIAQGSFDDEMAYIVPRVARDDDPRAIESLRAGAKQQRPWRLLGEHLSEGVREFLSTPPNIQARERARGRQPPSSLHKIASLGCASRLGL